MTALSKAIAKGYKATHDGVTKLYRKVTGKFGMTSNELIASGDDVGRISSHIAAELPRAGTRGGVSVERLSEFRNLPGKAAGNGKNITGNWIKGTENQAGFFPKSIADKMRNNNYNNFNEFREDFWKNIADDPQLRQQFMDNPTNLIEMQNGRAPFANVSQQIGGKVKYEIHHNTPINQGGEVYNFDNLTIVTPRYHKDILLPE